MRPLMRSIWIAAIAVAITLAGCTPIPGVPSADIIIPPETLNVSKSLAIPSEGLVAGALVFIVIDPLAPNWRIEQTVVDPNRYRLSLTKKRFTTGGDGEAMSVFKRRADELVREQKAAGYRIVAYSEGIESKTLIAQRVAEGVVEVVR